MKIKVGIIEDEFEAQRILKFYLSKIGNEFEITTVAETYEAGMILVQTAQIDLLFLDINLGGKSGMELIPFLDRNKTNVIFTTAYDEHILSALRLNATDYLLKPFLFDEFQDSIERFKKVYSNRRLNLRLSSISLSNSEGHHQVTLTDITFVEAAGPYCTFHLIDQKKIVLSKPLKNYENVLVESNLFVRVHKSYIVNLNCIKIFNRTDNKIILHNKLELPVSRKHKAILKDLLGE